MNWIKSLSLLLATFVICYILLMGGDILLSQYLDRQKILSFKEAYDIEQRRKQDEDIIYRRQALDNGYLPLVYPDYLDTNATMKQLVSDIGVALLGGVPKRKTYFCNEGYGLITYESDRFGFRNEDSKWDKDVDVLFIGDSFTHGACVDDESTMPQLFEQQTGCNTLNLGFNSNNPLHYKTYASLFIRQAKPKAVFMVFYSNDKGTWESITHDIYVKEGKPYFFEDDLKLAYPQITNDLYAKAIAEKEPSETTSTNIFTNLVRSLKYRKSLPTIRLLINFNLGTNLVGSSRDALVDAKKTCEAIGCELNVVYIPNSNFWRPDDFADSYADKLKSVADELSLRFFDIRKVLNTDKGSPDYAVKGLHLSPGGYRKAVSLILHKYGGPVCNSVLQANTSR